MKRYLVTGAAGFVGSAIAKSLLHKNHEVWTIDNLSTGFAENVPDGVVFIEGDCQKDSSIKQLGGKKFDAMPVNRPASIINAPALYGKGTKIMVNTRGMINNKVLSGR